MRNNLQDQFSKLLENAEVTPPEGSWERLENRLPASRPGLVQYRYAAVLLLLISTSICLFIVFDRFGDKGNNEMLTRMQKIPETPNPVNFTPTKNLHNPPVKPPTPVSNLSQSTVVSTIYGVVSGSSTASKPLVQHAGQAFDSEYNSAENISDNNQHTTLDPGVEADEFVNQTGMTPGHDHASWPSLNLSKEQSANMKMPEDLLDQPLLVSLGKAPVGNSLHHRKVHANLIAGKNIEIKPAILDKPTDDPERKEIRTKRLSQFKTFDVVRGFHLGLFVNLTSTWMTRKDDYLDHPGNLFDPKTYVGMAYGINAGYDISERWGLQLELAIRNSKGHRFDEKCIYTGEQMHKTLRLWYVRLPLMVKYKIMQINRPSGRPVVLGVLAGPLVNVLYKKQLYINNELAPVSGALINHTDIGAVGGLDLDIYLHKNFYVTAGTRLSFSSPLSRNLPMSLQLGFSAQINFRLPPREKH